MSTRLPIPGSDDGTWGDILNTYLDTAHNSDGSLKTSALQSAGGVTSINSKTPTNGTVTLSASDVSAIPSSQLGANSGVAQLDSGGNVPSSQLGNASGANVPTPTTSHQTIVSNNSDAWTLATAATIDTSDTPQPDTKLGNAGTNTTASASNHSHPLNLFGRNMAFGGFPPAYNYDVVLDGSWNGSFGSNWGYYKGGLGSLTLSGSTYTSPTHNTFFQNNIIGITARNITINAGITLKSAAAGQGLILVASNTITINGTVSCVGGAASGSTGGSGATNYSHYYWGASGPSGTTGAGTVGNAAYGNNGYAPDFAGGGGAGGASGGTAGGGAAAPQTYGNSAEFVPGGSSLIYLTGRAQNSYEEPTGGGYSGGSGAGDGSNAGGGGGGGGGVLIIVAPTIIIGSTAVLTVQGGAGGGGTGGNAGGGGGGGGGLIGIHGLSVTITSGAALTATGGAGGSASGSGVAGSAGTTSNFFTDPPTGNGGYGFGDGCLICQWQ